MRQAEIMLREMDTQNLSLEERAKRRALLARELTEGGNYEAARGAMGEFWSKVGDRPKVGRLSRETAAEILLRAGVLTGFIGSARSIAGAQELAKDLISESLSVFEQLNIPERVAEAQADMAYCYWRAGAFDEARVMLEEAGKLVEDSESIVRAVIIIRQAIIELSKKNYRNGLNLLRENEAFISEAGTHTVRGNFHQNLGIILKNLAVLENRTDYRDQSIIEYTAASYHFEQAGHMRYRARVENNLGYVLSTAEKHAEAHEHLNRARRLFLSLKDNASAAQVDDTQANVFLKQKKNAEAEKLARAAVGVHEQGDEFALLAEALVTHGKALARLNRPVDARATLIRAAETAERAGDAEGAADAYLTTIEEVGNLLSDDEILSAWENADLHLPETKHPETLQRLRSASRRLLVNRRMAALEMESKEFIHASPESEELLRRAQVIARVDCTVLLTGESGTGKEVIANLIHKWSGREGEFVALNCAAIPDALMESELFGHRKGAFTDAVSDYKGATLHATGGTLFLDEVGELSLSSQGKILRLIENKEIHSVGASYPETVNVRIIAATNRSLQKIADEGKFRTDLLYRLRGFSLELKPLRERQDDIEALASHFIHDAVRRYRKQVTFTPEAVRELRQLPLQGNARELRALIESAILMSAKAATITAESVRGFAIRSKDNIGLTIADPWASCSLDDEVLRYEGQIIRLALEKGGTVTGAARLLGISHQRLSSILNGRQKDIRGKNTRKISIMHSNKSAVRVNSNSIKV